MRTLAQILSLAFAVVTLAALTLRASPGCTEKRVAPTAQPAAQAVPAQPAPTPVADPVRFMPASKAGPVFVPQPAPQK